MKRLIAFLLVFAMTAGMTGVFADSQVLRLSLEEAQARALENNVTYRLQDGTINDALQNYYDTQDSNDKQAGIPTSGYLAYFNRPITLEANLQSSIDSVTLARFKKNTLKRTSNNDVLTAFINIKKAQYAMEDAKNNVSLKKKDYDTAQTKYQLGLLIADDLKTAEKAYRDAEKDVDTALKKLQEEIQDLNRLIGRELTNYNIEPVISLGIPDLSSIDLDKIREDYIKNDENLYSLSLNVESAKRKYDLTKERYDHFIGKLNVRNSRDDIENAYDQTIRNYENARNKFEDATKSLDMQLTSTYNSLKNANESISRILRDMQDLKSDIEKAKIKLDLGSISKNDYEKMEMSLKTMQNKLDSAIADYNLLYAGLMIYSDNKTEVANK